MKPYPNEELARMSKREIIRLYKRTVEQFSDAVPVIRCCDCMHFEYFEDQFVQMTHCDVHDKCPDYTDFCSWAERKDNG